MVLAYITGDSGHGDFDHIISKSIAMLGDAHRSFELATQSILSDDAADALAREIREIDRRINKTEHRLRSELVIHASMTEKADIGSVVGFTLLLKKIERVGDHAKNILELTENGVSLAEVPEIETLLAEREVLSDLFSRTAGLLTTADPAADAVEDYIGRANHVIAECQARIDSYMVSDRPGREVVPLAIYYRFLRRIAANLLGVVWATTDPVPYLDLDQLNDDSSDS